MLKLLRAVIQTRYIVILLALFLPTTFTACKKGAAGPQGPEGIQGSKGDKGEKGDEGDTGPRGETGPRGATGATGPKGDKGDPGTANVIYSDWLPADWNVTDDPDYKLMSIIENRLTPEFRDTGVLLVYYRWKLGASVFTYLLPQVFYRPDGTLDRQYQAYIYENENKIMIRASSHGATFYPDEVNNTHNWFRYVLVPGGVDLSAMVDGGLNLNNYSDVVQALESRH